MPTQRPSVADVQRESFGVPLPILEAVLPSNRLQIEAARLKIYELGARSVGILGLSYKPGTDDVRESPVVDLICALRQDGVAVLVHDPDVQVDNTISNRACLERLLPGIDQMLHPNIEDVLSQCQVLVVAQKRQEFIAVLRRLKETNRDVIILDLVRLSEEPFFPGTFQYEGISW